MKPIQPSNDGLDLTILSVSFHSQPYLELNYALTQYLNPSDEVPWIVVQNTPPPGEPLQSHGTLTVVEGVPHDPDQLRADSDHHARALNEGIRRVRTRFALVLDPDFFIVRNEWCKHILEYMQSKQLSALGVTWHPRWWRKYRKFPAPHCLFLDLSYIDPATCDFSPGTQKFLSPNPAALSTNNDKGLWSWLGRRFLHRWNMLRSYPLFRTDLRAMDDSYNRGYFMLWHELDIAIHRGQYVNLMPDTGYLLHRKLEELNLAFEFIPVVFRPEQDYRMISYMPFLQKLVDLVVTPDLALVPKQEGYYVRQGFRETGYPDAGRLDCEEFMWEGKPFAFHVRNQPRGNWTKPIGHGQILSLIEELTGFIPHPGR